MNSILDHTCQPTAEEEIRALLERRMEAVRRQDLETIMVGYTPDVLAFDTIGKLQYQGIEAYRQHWRNCIGTCQGPIVMEMAEPHIEAADALAFAYWLCRCGCADPDGEVKAAWMRASACLRKVGGQWKIAHEHWSVPLDVESGRAQLELVP
ncbi:YybH family protein [Azotobacter bryophylli]|uniref:YybH family protein n=1 Tax=Azotobacter bryophylli TaxID=1986537 RepID=A0ABV7AXF0_9GAMM